jgi:hypothetical protein
VVTSRDKEIAKSAENLAVDVFPHLPLKKTNSTAAQIDELRKPRFTWRNQKDCRWWGGAVGAWVDETHNNNFVIFMIIMA